MEESLGRPWSERKKERKRGKGGKRGSGGAKLFGSVWAT